MASLNLGLAFLFFVVSEGLTQYVTRNLSDEELKHAPEVIADFRKQRSKEKASAWATSPKVSDADRWFNLIDVNQGRFDALGAVLILRPRVTKLADISTGKPVITEKWGAAAAIGHCTAFYIAPTVLATAAHCLNEAGVSKDSDHLLFFRQRYDGGLGAYSPSDVDAYERLVVEWTYLAVYEKRNAGTCPDDGKPCIAGEECKDGSTCQLKETTGKDYGFDFAFMRTDRAGQTDAKYTLVSVDEYMPKPNPGQSAQPKHTRLILAGYPGNFAEFYRPVYVNCQLGGSEDKIVKEDAGILFQLKKNPKLLEDAKDNQVFCIGDKGNMGKGGSGGPWLLDATEISNEDSEKTKKLRYVVGITSWGIKVTLIKGLKPGSAVYNDAVKDIRQKMRATVSPRLSAHAVRLANAAANVKAGESIEDALKKVSTD